MGGAKKLFKSARDPGKVFNFGKDPTGALFGKSGERGQSGLLRGPALSAAPREFENPNPLFNLIGGNTDQILSDILAGLTIPRRRTTPTPVAGSTVGTSGGGGAGS